MSRDSDTKDALISNEVQLQYHSFTFIHKNESLLSDTGFLFRSPLTYNTPASLDNLTCANYVDFGKCPESFGQFFWSKRDSNYLDVTLKVVKKNDNKDF